MTSQWVKEIELSKEVKLIDFSLSDKFTHVANVLLTTSQAVKTCIFFDSVIEKKDWENKTSQWIYMFTVDDYIVKIGGTRSGLKGRVGSYLCGHHTTDRGKSGKCSVTNAYIYNTFEDLLKKNHSIKMLGYKIPDAKITMSVWDTDTVFSPQTYTVYETSALETYKIKCGHYPQLSDNSDPSHR
jgi:hypothetical protein